MGHIGNRRGFEKLESLVKIGLLQQGYCKEEISMINTRMNIFRHITRDRCLHKVFNDLWVRNLEPIDNPDPHEINYSQVLQMQPESSINDDDVIIKYEPMWPVQDGPDNETWSLLIICYLCGRLFLFNVIATYIQCF